MKLAEVTPTHCARCFQQKPDERHVDFDAAYDGPVIPGTPEPICIDDLVLCESCMREAARLLGLVDWAEAGEQIATLKTQLATAEETLLERQAYVDQLEAAVSAKPKPAGRAKASA